MTFLTTYKLHEYYAVSQISPGRNSRSRNTWVIKIRVLKNFFANGLALSATDGNISGTLNRGTIWDLPLLRTLIASHQKLPQPSFREIIGSFVLLT